MEADREVDRHRKLSFDESDFAVLMAMAGFRSTAALARAAALSGGYLRMVARGLVPPEHTREKIAAVLGVPASRVWPEKDAPTPPAGQGVAA